MNADATPRGRNLWVPLFTLMVSVMLAACASPPPAPVAAVMTKLERTIAALKAMNFDQAEDGWRLTLPAPLIFPFDSDVVAASARDTLTHVGRELKELGIDRALVRGHTDNVGTNDYNLGLSKRRADAVAKVLSEGGFPVDRIDSKGLAASMPTADNATAEGRSKNRRVVIIVQVI